MDYYSYLWERHGTFDVRHNFNLSSELSKCLNSEIFLFFHRRMVTRVPIFRYSSPRVVQAVITCLVPEIYIAGDFIVRCGSRTGAMFFIRDGRCSVLLDDSDPGKGVMHRVNVLRHALWRALALRREPPRDRAHPRRHQRRRARPLQVRL